MSKKMIGFMVDFFSFDTEKFKDKSILWQKCYGKKCLHRPSKDKLSIPLFRALNRI